MLSLFIELDQFDLILSLQVFFSQCNQHGDPFAYCQLCVDVFRCLGHSSEPFRRCSPEKSAVAIGGIRCVSVRMRLCSRKSLRWLGTPKGIHPERKLYQVNILHFPSQSLLGLALTMITQMGLLPVCHSGHSENFGRGL
jgi:hypothetical protein